MATRRIPFVQFAAHQPLKIRYSEAVGVQYVPPDANGDRRAYGNAIRDRWIHEGRPIGLVTIEHDIALSSAHFSTMMKCVEMKDDCIWAYAYLLYPASTKRLEPCWSVMPRNRDGGLRYLRRQDYLPHTVSHFSLGFTYLPAALLDDPMPTDGSADYPVTDTYLSRRAESLGITARVLQGTDGPIHLHWELEPSYNEIVAQTHVGVNT